MKNVEIIDELKQDPQNIIFVGKRALEDFQATNPDFHLRSLVARNAAVTGFPTNVFVEPPIHTDHEKGFYIIPSSNGTSIGSVEIQELTVQNKFPTFSFLMTN
jgi:hypothetical protein